MSLQLQRRFKHKCYVLEFSAAEAQNEAWSKRSYSFYPVHDQLWVSISVVENLVTHTWTKNKWTMSTLARGLVHENHSDKVVLLGSWMLGSEPTNSQSKSWETLKKWFAKFRNLPSLVSLRLNVHYLKQPFKGFSGGKKTHLFQPWDYQSFCWLTFQEGDNCATTPETQRLERKNQPLAKGKASEPNLYFVGSTCCSFSGRETIMVKLIPPLGRSCHGLDTWLITMSDHKSPNSLACWNHHLVVTSVTHLESHL